MGACFMRAGKLRYLAQRYRVSEDSFIDRERTRFHTVEGEMEGSAHEQFDESDLEVTMRPFAPGSTVKLAQPRLVYLSDG